MAGSKLRKAIGAVKDQTSIGLAKVGSSTCLSDLEVAIVKATRHEEYPADERYIREIMSLTCYSRAYVSACVSFISRRLSKTKNWVVALKTLMLIQRLLMDGDPAYKQEVFFATRLGTRLLNMSDFRDASRSDSWDYSAFVRTYAMYLDEQLELRMQNRRGRRPTFAFETDEEETVGPSAIVVRTTPVREMKNERIFSKAHHLMQLLERFLACRPTGLAKNNRIVIVAMYPVVKESFQLYYDISEIMGVLIDRFMELDIPDSLKVFDFFCRISKQYDELDAFYAWCKIVGICRAADFPDVEKVPQKKLDVMDEFIREKSIMAQNRERITEPEPEPEPVPEPEEKAEENEPEDDMNAVKALPAPPLDLFEARPPQEEEPKPKTQDVGDLLNLGEDAPTTEQHGDQLALALFDGNLSTNAPATSGTSAWEAFNETGDWETSLVQTASHLSSQQASLPNGFSTLMLDGMYQQGTVQQAVASSGVTATGSASSVALGSAGRPAMLALPAPPGGDGATPQGGSDPFAASVSVAPPSYVQMSEMEKKQRFLVEEQMMWQQYTRNGMQGEGGLSKAQQQTYAQNMGSYPRTY